MTLTNEDLLALADRLDEWREHCGYCGRYAVERNSRGQCICTACLAENNPGYWGAVHYDTSAALRDIVAVRKKPQHGKEVMPNDDNSSHIRPAVSPRLTAGAQAIRDKALDDAAMCCEVEADKCDDAVKWGGAPKYIANCKAAAYAMRDRAAAIRAMKGKPE